MIDPHASIVSAETFIRCRLQHQHQPDLQLRPDIERLTKRGLRLRPAVALSCLFSSVSAAFVSHGIISLLFVPQFNHQLDGVVQIYKPCRCYNISKHTSNHL